MFWRYTSNKEWLEERKGYVTASEVAEWHKTSSRPKEETIKNCLKKAWFNNNSHFPIEVGSPSSAAARGHCMEPFAVEEWNHAWQDEHQMIHFDDVFLHEDNGIYGFSPDAMNAEDINDVTEILEVKCYGPEEHMKAWLEDKSKRKERWQIAVAMKVCPQIEVGHVLWYSPNSVAPMVSRAYTRQDLTNELDKLEIYRQWYEDIAEELHFYADSEVMTNNLMYDEETIYNICSEEWN